MTRGLNVQTCWSTHTSEQQAVAELRERLGDEPGALVLIYAWPDYDLDVLTEAVRHHFRHATVAGCTTAGQVLEGHGYVASGMAGLSLSSPQLQVERLDVANVATFTSHAAQALADAAEGHRPPGSRSFGLLLIDGLGGREEFVASALSAVFNDTPIVGGSAGDAGRFDRTHVWTADGFRSNAASLVLVHTTLPFRTFSAQHFDCDDRRMVVTDADVGSRIVHTIDGRPARKAYAEAIGVAPDRLSPSDWAHRPLLIKAGEQLFVRSIRESRDDGSLLLYSAIDTGMVLRIGQPRDQLSCLANSIADLRDALPGMQVIVGFDCILRREELVSTRRLDEARQNLSGSGMFAFSTYGEQINGIHCNQTLTGVALGQE